MVGQAAKWYSVFGWRFSVGEEKGFYSEGPVEQSRAAEWSYGQAVRTEVCPTAVRCRSRLNEEVEEDQKEADGQEDGAAVDATAGMASEAANEAGGFSGAGDLFAEAVKTGGDGVANEAAADGAEFIVNPDGNIDAVEPEKNCSADKNNVAKYGEKTQRGTGTPEHADSFNPTSAAKANSSTRAGTTTKLSGTAITRA